MAVSELVILNQANTAPSVALNSPSNSATGVSTTPDLNFTGTDVDADAIEYNVQVDTVNTFDSTNSLVDSWDTSHWVDQADWIYDTADTDTAGQSFTGIAGNLISCKFYMYSAGTPTGYAYAKLYAHSGVYGTSSRPTGLPLAVSTDKLDVSTLTGTPQLVTFHFDGTYTLQAGTYYCIVVFYNSSNGANPVKVAKDTATAGASGNEFNGVQGGTFITDSTHDLIFYVYVGHPLLYKLSVNGDATFTDVTNGAHTHPFPSGEQIKYTVQAGDTLGNNTLYYWRVLGTDPSGSNMYGLASPTYSFTTTSGVAAPTGLFFDANDGAVISQHNKSEVVGY